MANIISQIELHNCLVVSSGDQLTNIATIIPYLSQRQHASKMALRSNIEETEYKNLMGIIEYCNNSIQKVLGIPTITTN